MTQIGDHNGVATGLGRLLGILGFRSGLVKNNP